LLLDDFRFYQSTSNQPRTNSLLIYPIREREEKKKKERKREREEERKREREEERKEKFIRYSFDVSQKIFISLNRKGIGSNAKFVFFQNVFLLPIVVQ
jgi:hypothetical protein